MNAVQSWLDKIRHTAGQGNNPSALEIDLMLEYTRRLYEAIASLRQAPAAPEPLNTAAENRPEAEPIFINIPDAGSSPELAPEPEPDPVMATIPVVPEPTREESVPVILREEAPESVTPAELYSRNMTSFQVSGKDIRMYIGINDKYNFISELFTGNSEAYEEILDEINTFETREDAVFFLENSGVTTLYHWDEESFSVRIFYNVLSQFFASR